MTPAETKAADPGKLIIRLVNRLSGLESLRSRSLSEIDQLTTEAAHAHDDIARPFTQAGQLAAARGRVRCLEEKLRETAAPSRRHDHDWLLASTHDAAVMAGIPSTPIVIDSHQDGQPQSTAQVSQCDFPADNPLAGTTSAAGQAIARSRIQTPRAPRHLT